ncbi:protein phosphatase 2a regulatory subunit 4 [Moniliophthora roreri MCA 2997]|uniref:Serine/threonine-protein phosphatase 2A activator n=2 Tax=Moniliophthora roreri TaxID=221103 RepID=V2Y7E5_MONRO|nr:protein phosphatase 2a regulatory subunit 4 [Moniliophthora roreri MCA 2997]KAI3619534.1 protein phosphatase 2a regulatory subunit 4 [Moniliophthora roreri]
MELRRIPLSEIPNLETPTQKIHSDQDVQVWRTTQSYHDFSIFLRRLTESVVGYTLPWSSASPSTSIVSTVKLLDTLDSWIDEIPPQETPQRFGNLSFRKWGARLEERVDQLLTDLVSHEFTSLIPHVKPYLLTSFGSFLRMDYGTGHETSFALFLLCLTLVRFFQPQPDEERELVFRVFTRYLQLCWKLQDVYRLEPAGSHGVWGLDDSHFLGYIFGSGQLRDQTEIPVSAVLHPPLPPTNLYFMSIMRIHQVKHGPFHEHSSQLHSIAVGVPNWGKVNSGLFKMYEAEVLGKRVVVQHIPLSGLLEWSHNGAGQTDTPQQGTSSANASATSNPSSLQAPWATTVHSQPHSQTTMPARSSWSTQTHLPRSRATPGNQQSEDFM